MCIRDRYQRRVHGGNQRKLLMEDSLTLSEGAVVRKIYNTNFDKASRNIIREGDPEVEIAPSPLVFAATQIAKVNHRGPEDIPETPKFVENGLEGELHSLNNLSDCRDYESLSMDDKRTSHPDKSAKVNVELCLGANSRNEEVVLNINERICQICFGTLGGSDGCAEMPRIVST
eukprot:TRINITY_DN4406_c0_g1_i3.p2 TRINITY_DN4406_c0_g1~~TRINITY_DN4406_c0_g1_i3.p2  ORF type:complete len:174 (+),score=33.81 TRINITY_DN4406_c0_g1_i3:64-585(+)